MVLPTKLTRFQWSLLNGLMLMETAMEITPTATLEICFQLNLPNGPMQMLMVMAIM